MVVWLFSFTIHIADPRIHPVSILGPVTDTLHCAVTALYARQGLFYIVFPTEQMISAPKTCTQIRMDTSNLSLSPLKKTRLLPSLMVVYIRRHGDQAEVLLE